MPSDSLRSPHDPDATYGHKGKGYEVQVAETYGNKREPAKDDDPDPDDRAAGGPPKLEMITYVALTDSCSSDADAALSGGRRPMGRSSFAQRV